MDAENNHKDRPGTHCSICGAEFKVPAPGAVVTHMDCLLAATTHLREKADDGQIESSN